MKTKFLAYYFFLGFTLPLFSEGVITALLEESSEFKNEELVAEEDLDNIYEKAFGKKPPKAPAKLRLPLFLNHVEGGQVLIILSDFRTIEQIERKPLVEGLDMVLKEEVRNDVFSKIPNEELISPDVLRQAGIDVHYDSYAQKLELKLPPSLMGPVRTSLVSRFSRPGAYTPVIETGGLSNIFNYRVTKSFEHTRPGGSTPLSDPWQIEIDDALQYRSYVLESYILYDDDANEKWVPFRIRLVKDFKKALLRASVGDIDSPHFGYLSPHPLGGLGARTFFGVDPELITYPKGDLRFFLENDSQVELFVNGQLVSTLQLPAGEHYLVDVPYGGGFSEYEIRIIDSFGREQILNGTHALESQLLDPEIPEYGLFMGYPLEFPNGRKRYETANLNTIGYFRKGLTNQLTVGVHEQTDKDGFMVGGEAVYGSVVGVFEWDFGVSVPDDIHTDFATRLLWYSPTRWSIDNNWPYLSIYGEFIGKRFTPVGSSADLVNNEAYIVSASISKHFNPGWTATLTGDYTLERSTTHNPYSLIWILRKVWPKWVFSTELEYDQTNTGRIIRSAFVRVNYRADEFFVSATHSTVTQATSLSASYVPRRNYGLSGGAIYTHTPTSEAVTGRGTYRHNRFTLSAANTYTYTDGIGTRDYTTVTFSSAILYTDGVLALSRPVYDSFLFVDAIPGFEDIEIGVNPRLTYDDYETKFKDGSTGVLATEASYFPNRVEIVAPDLPLGRDLGPSRFNFYPTYRSGARLTVGTDAQVMLQLNVTDTLGNVLIYEAGELVPEEGGESIEVFTSKRGMLRTPAITTGTYKLRFYNANYKERVIFIPSEAEGIFKMDLVIERANLESDQ